MKENLSAQRLRPPLGVPTLLPTCPPTSTHPLLFLLVPLGLKCLFIWSSSFEILSVEACRAVLPRPWLASQLSSIVRRCQALGNIGVGRISAFGAETDFASSPDSCHGKAEECIGLCRALLSALHWLLRCTAASAERLREGLEAGTPAAGEKQLAMCLQRLEKTLSSTKNRALLHIAKLEEACMSPGSPSPTCHCSHSPFCN